MSDTESIHLAVDLGAGSGRVIAGIHSSGKLRLVDVHRFANEPIEEDGHLFWDFEQLMANIREGLAKAARDYGAGAIRSIGVDTWGVDHGLFDAQGELLARPYHYRDVRNVAAYDEVMARTSRDTIFAHSGIQFMAINTLYQLRADVREHGGLMARVSHFLLIPDIVNLRLTGVAACERTNASTTQFYNPATGEWATELLDAIEWPASKVPPLVDAGTRLGPLLPDLAAATGLDPDTPVFAVGSHDTASAVAAVPAQPGARSAYLSSGTWSLLGVECDAPVINAKCQEYNFTNEVGVFGTIRLLKNINGLWLVQECRRVWSEQGDDRDFAELTRLTEEAPPLVSFIDPDDPRFAGRGDMPSLVQDACRASGQAVPEDHAAILRTITESLALKYNVVLERLEDLIGHRVDRLHVIGGGGRNRLLNQCIANSIDRPVEVGPIEATAAGNVMMQMVASGALDSLQAGRALIRASYGTEVYEPRDSAAWAAARERFARLAAV